MATPISLNLDALDGIRGIASVVIVVGHLLTFWVPRWDTATNAPSGTFIAFGLEYLSPVTFFVVASGFTLVLVYDRKASPSAPSSHAMDASSITAAFSDSSASSAATLAQSLVHAASASAQPWIAGIKSSTPFPTWSSMLLFMRHRLARLAGMYYLGLALGVVPFILYSDMATIITSAIATPLGLQSIVITGIAWDGPLWTVSAFLLCYATFIPLMHRLRRLETFSLLAITLGISGSLIVTAASLILAGLGPLLHVCGPLRIPQFIAGMAVAYLARRTPLPHPTLIAEACSAIVLLNVALCAIVTWLTGNQFKWYITYAYGAEWVLTPIHALWMWALASPDCAGLSRPFLTSRPLLWLGDISYALYCLHWPTLNWATWVTAAKGVSAAAAPMYATTDGPTGWFAFPPWAIPPLLGICIAVAAIAHYTIEEPVRRWVSGKATHGRRAAAGAKAAAATRSRNDPTDDINGAMVVIAAATMSA